MKKIILKRSKCIGCGVCQAVCPKFFEMNENNYSHLKGSKINKEADEEELSVDNVECAEQAEKMCPAKAIIIQ